MNRVIAYFAVIIVIIIPTVVTQIYCPISMHRGQKFTMAKMDLINMMSLLDAFKIDKGQYPSEEEGLEVLESDYIARLSRDRWDNKYIYLVPADEKKPLVYSVGPDGKDNERSGDDVTVDTQYDCTLHGTCLSFYDRLSELLMAISFFVVPIFIIALLIEAMLLMKKVILRFIKDN